VSIGFVFWLIMLLILLSAAAGHYGFFAYGFWVSGTLIFILLGLLGWRLFGAPIRNDGPPPKP
jgi:uncharacterized membrane protein YdbT with pleckstrin-like domain